MMTGDAHMKACLETIPEDVFLLIVEQLAVWDILSLKQTCRKLHEVCSLASIWYHFYKNLPLESKWSDLDLPSVANTCWQTVVIRAMKTDQNWRRSSPRLRGLRKVADGALNGIASHTRLFNRGEALLWISYPRHRSEDFQSVIAIWDIRHPDSPCLRWRFSSLGFGSFFDLYEGNGRAVIAYGRDVGRVRGELVIYELASDLSGELATFGPFTMEGVPGTAEDISVFGDVAAMMFVDFSNRGPASTDGHKIVILNWKTGASVQIDPDLPLDFNRVGIQLYLENYILYWQRDETASVELHNIPNLQGPSATILPAVPPACYQRHQALSTVRGWSWSLKLRVSPPFLNLPKTASNPPLISCLLFPSITRPSPIEHYTLPIVPVPPTEDAEELTREDQSSNSRSKSQSSNRDPKSCHHRSKINFSPPIKHSIPMRKSRVSPRKLCVGPSGRRAVWLEQDFDSDDLDLRLMRLAPNTSCDGFDGDWNNPGSGFNIKELKPNTLPFLTSEILCMAFDEVSTRLVLSLIQGDIWVLDFA